MALPRELGLRRERVMHPDQRARSRRHPGADSALVEHADLRARARQVKRKRASNHARTNYNYVRALCCHRFRPAEAVTDLKLNGWFLDTESAGSGTRPHMPPLVSCGAANIQELASTDH